MTFDDIRPIFMDSPPGTILFGRFVRVEDQGYSYDGVDDNLVLDMDTGLLEHWSVMPELMDEPESIYWKSRPKEEWVQLRQKAQRHQVMIDRAQRIIKESK